MRGTINGFEFRTSLFSIREGRHFILVSKRMQEDADGIEASGIPSPPHMETTCGAAIRKSEGREF